jgi:hypothetical protein
LGGLLISPWGLGAADSWAAGRHGEKSIVLSSQPGEETEVAVATDRSAPEAQHAAAGSTSHAPIADEYASQDVADFESTAAESADAASGQEVIAELDPASFNGATPGVTTRAEVLRDWGQPAEIMRGGETLIYRLPGFKCVTLRFDADCVTSLRIELAAETPAANLVGKLGLATIRPAVQCDEFGAPVSTAFPERGVTFLHRVDQTKSVMAHGGAATAVAADPPVDGIVIRPITAALFILRAETTPGRSYTCRIADLETALELEPASAHARWMLSQAKLATGAAVTAEKLAREAVDLDARDDNYRLQWVRCLKYLARYDEAVSQTRLILEGSTATPIIRAQALEQMGLLASLGSREVQERSVPLHNKAIALADPLATSDDPAVRIAANQLLVGAHLAIAEQIACGDYQDKPQFVAQWISRSSALVEQMIEAGEADVSLRLQVAISALEAGAKLNPPIDPKLWIDEAEQAVAALPTEDDPLAQAEIDWQLGLAYLYATEISHRRGQGDAALDYGAFADAKLGAAAEARKEMPDTQFVLGRLYFQIGAVYAVHRADHAVACQWYDRAIEPLSNPVPVTPLAAPGQHADALVSMAVSYWETGDRERAYELTGAGVELVEQGVDEGLLTAEALEVPQNNFAAMSRALGKVQLETPKRTTGQQTAQVATNQPAPTKNQASRPATAGASTARTASRRNITGAVQRR